MSPRGAGYLFGSDVVAQFNAANDIDMICRAHQLVMEGYKWHFNETVLTVWSAPNYCYRCGNVAAILELDEHLQKDFIIFEAAPQETRGIPSKKARGRLLPVTPSAPAPSSPSGPRTTVTLPSSDGGRAWGVHCPRLCSPPKRALQG